MVLQHKITFNEDEVIDLYLVLVEKNGEVLEEMLTSKNIEEKKAYIKQSLKIHEKINLLANKLGLEE